MAIRPRNIFSSVSGFFFSPRRRKPTSGGGKFEDPAMGRFLAGFDEGFAAVNAPEQVAENYRKDVTDAFKVKATPRSGYDPGSYGPPISVNLYDFFTDPVKTVGKTVSSVFSTDWSDFVANPIDVWKETDSQVLGRLRDTWYGPAGDRRFIPSSVYSAFEQWNAVAGSTEDMRRLRDIRKNPGYTLMLTRRMEGHYAGLGMAGPLLGGQTLGVIRATAESREAELTQVLARAENASKPGPGQDLNLADSLYREAGEIQKAWESQSKGYRKEVDHLFAWHAAGGALAGTPEAQFRRYWMNRNRHYQTLNFLRTWKKDGLPGAFKEYIWKQVVKDHVFAKGTPFYYLYPPHAVEWATGKTLGALVKPLTDKLYKLRVAFVRLRNKISKDIIKKVLSFIGTKLGLKALAAWIGTIIAPGAGTAVGAVVGAALQFVVGEFVSAFGGALKLIGAGLLGCATLVFLGAVFTIVVVGNIIFPWEETPAGTTPGEVDCNQSAPNVSVSGLIGKEDFGRLADRHIDSNNFADECYNDVIAKARAAGVNPAYALATWLIESGASNYGASIQDFGINRSDVVGFTAQITRFLSTVGSTFYASCYSQTIWADRMEATLYMYRTGNCVKAGNTDGLAYYNSMRNYAFPAVGCSFPTSPTQNTCR
ncbi:MAG: hypothetical protein WEC39_02110 [Patescibacteria group bacterium]